MNIEFELFTNGDWNFAGVVKIPNPDAGFLGESTLTYDLDYWAANAALEGQTDKVVRDIRAVSIADPVDLDTHYRKTWPPFMLDLLPGGRSRAKLAAALKIDANARSSDIPLLMRSAGSPVGNIRIKGTIELENARRLDSKISGVSLTEIHSLSDRFMELFERHSIIASGAIGLQGEWPKIAMTLASDGLYYPDPFVKDDEAIDHVIVKLQRSKDKRDEIILHAEGIYSHIAKWLGLNVYETSDYKNGALIIRRFDRRREGGRTERLGQESLVSALDVAEFGYLGYHEDYLDIIKAHSTAPFDDVVEYLKREIANLALGNTDNHGRNTAFSKGNDLSIRLSPLFDFAPMRLALESIPRSTRWKCMKPANRDHSPNWQIVCETIFSDDARRAGQLFEELANFAEALNSAPKIAKELGADEIVLDVAMSRCADIIRLFDKPSGLNF